jgi:GntR family transcriptional regulator
MAGDPQDPPEVRRMPPYLQVAGYWRDKILAGDLKPGDQLPRVRDLMELHDVARATVARAIGQLAAEQAVWTSNQGTFVSGNDRITRTPTGRLRGPLARRIGLGEAVTVDEAGLVAAPDYVAALTGLDPGDTIVRRQERTWRNGQPVMLSVDWIPAGHKMLAAQAVSQAPLPDGIAHLIGTLTGRQVTHTEDHLRAREADRREAQALAIPVASPVLAGASIWADGRRPLVYTEFVLPRDKVISFTFAVQPAADTPC